MTINFRVTAVSLEGRGDPNCADDNKFQRRLQTPLRLKMPCGVGAAQSRRNIRVHSYYNDTASRIFDKEFMRLGREVCAHRLGVRLGTR